MFFLVIMIMIGGITRLTDSGLSIVTWKPITGFIPPINHEQWIESFNEYKTFPEYQLKSIDMKLSEYKFIYFWEYMHRMMGRFFGFLFIIPFSLFLIRGYLDKLLIRKLLFVFVLGGLQGFVGWYMVKSGLVNKPDVSHYRLALHLFIAFIILSYIYKLKMSLLFDKINKVKNYKFYNLLSLLIIFLLFLQIIYGAFNAGLKTSNIINTFPFYNGMFFPFSEFNLTPMWLNFFENKFGVQFIHRYLAFIIIFIIGFFTYNVNSDVKRIKLESQYIITLIVYQCILGVLTLVSSSAIIFALIHQLIAIFSILVMVRIKHKLKYISNEIKS